MIKVIHIISNDQGGGAERHLLDILRTIDRSKFQVVVICPQEGYYVDDYRKYAKVYQLDFLKQYWKLWKGLRQIIIEEAPQIIHNHLFRACLFGTLASITLNKKLKIITNHHLEASDLVVLSAWKKSVIHWTNYLLSPFVDKVICVSKYSQEKMLEQGIPKRKIQLIYNGIDQKRFTPKNYNHAAFDENHKFTITFVGRLHPQKGIDILLKVIERLPKTFNVNIIGTGSLSEIIKQEISDKGWENIQVTGFVKHVERYLKESDLFLFPTNGDVFGLVVAEAMACKLPIVCSNVGGLPELVIEGKGGFLCPPKDVDLMIEKILLLANDASMRQAFGEFNRTRFEEQFTLKSMMKGIEGCYEELENSMIEKVNSL